MFNWLKNLFKSKPNKVKKRFISDDEFNAMKKGREDKLNRLTQILNSTIPVSYKHRIEIIVNKDNRTNRCLEE